jgi:hypothetical protein
MPHLGEDLARDIAREPENEEVDHDARDDLVHPVGHDERGKDEAEEPPMATADTARPSRR